jgi:hypothetical protein
MSGLMERENMDLKLLETKSLDCQLMKREHFLKMIFKRQGFYSLGHSDKFLWTWLNFLFPHIETDFYI